MEITREAIEERRKQLQAEHQQAIATTHAISGAIQDCDFWLSVLEEKEAVKDGGSSRNPDGN